MWWHFLPGRVGNRIHIIGACCLRWAFKGFPYVLAALPKFAIIECREVYYPTTKNHLPIGTLSDCSAPQLFKTYMLMLGPWRKKNTLPPCLVATEMRLNMEEEKHFSSSMVWRCREILKHLRPNQSKTTQNNRQTLSQVGCCRQWSL